MDGDIESDLVEVGHAVDGAMKLAALTLIFLALVGILVQIERTRPLPPAAFCGTGVPSCPGTLSTGTVAP